MEISAFHAIRRRVDSAALAVGTTVRLLAVCKHQTDAAVSLLAALGQHAFGENYVQALAVRRERVDAPILEWHLIGGLQSNKCRAAALHADWVQSVDRTAVVRELARHRPESLPPLTVLVQVNIDSESGKSGCTPAIAAALCASIAAQPQLRLRGLMAIPHAATELEDRRRSFAAMRALFERVRPDHADFDTLSMGMSDDFELAIAEGATMVRIGTAVFGARASFSP
ncbi:MAG: YggS family pyridoxal phosphate-dependent enzyme [Lysobacterales bacterium]